MNCTSFNIPIYIVLINIYVGIFYVSIDKYTNTSFEKSFLQLLALNGNWLSESIVVLIHSGGVLINKECVSNVCSTFLYYYSLESQVALSLIYNVTHRNLFEN
jgi:hypothetical protein